MNVSKLRIAVVGCGRIFDSHFKAIQNNSATMELVAICDRNPTSLQKAHEKANVNQYTNLEDMLRYEHLDCVSICTPNGFHYENAKKILKSKINVIVEKPLTLDFKEGQELIKLAKKVNKHVFLIHQNRFNPTIQCVKQAIDDGMFGHIYMMTSNVFWYRDDNYYTASSWHGSKTIDGGAFATQASHYTDIMNWFSDSKLKSIYAVGKTRKHKIETEDCGMAIIEWDNNTIANINLSVVTYNQNYEGSLTIIGEKGFVKIGGVALNKIEDWKFEDNKKEFCNTISYDTASVYGNGHTPYYESVANTLLNDKPFLISDADALGSLQISCGIIKSMNKNKLIKY